MDFNKGEDYYDKYEITEEDVFWIEEKEDRVRLTASPGRDWKLKTFLKYLKNNVKWISRSFQELNIKKHCETDFTVFFLYSLYKELKNF